MKVFYHNDLDGKCSAAIVAWKYYNYLEPEDLIEINYGHTFPWGKIAPGEDVWMVDFCLQPFEDMLRLQDSCNLTWIDHHISAIKEYEKKGLTLREIEGLREVGRAACQLVWQYCHFPPQLYPEPEAVTLLGRYDIWDLDQEVLAFQMGMRLKDFSVTDDFWKIMFETQHQVKRENWIHNIKQEGTTVLDWENVRAKEYCRSYASENFWMGYRCVALNVGRCSSTFFDSTYNLKDYDIYIAYNRLPSKRWTVSLYSERVDVSEIAKSFGGGGHKGASGFQCDFLPFDV